MIKIDEKEISCEMKKMTAGHESSSQVDMNHWLLRLVAIIIDSIPFAIIVYIIFWALVWSTWWSWGWGWGYWLLWPFAFGVLEVLYFIFMEVSSGATIGKKLLGLQVQMLDGSKITFDKALIRNISKIYGLFLLLDWLIGVATPGPDPHQKYTDRIAGTTVISVRQAFAAAGTPPPPPPPPP